jgi:hypothetical protein
VQKQKIQLLSPFINEKRMIQNTEEIWRIFLKNYLNQNLIERNCVLSRKNPETAEG